MEGERERANKKEVGKRISVVRKNTIQTYYIRLSCIRHVTYNIYFISLPCHT